MRPLPKLDLPAQDSPVPNASGTQSKDGRSETKISKPTEGGSSSPKQLPRTDSDNSPRSNANILPSDMPALRSTADETDEATQAARSNPGSQQPLSSKSNTPVVDDLIQVHGPTNTTHFKPLPDIPQLFPADDAQPSTTSKLAGLSPANRAANTSERHGTAPRDDDFTLDAKPPESRPQTSGSPNAMLPAASHNAAQPGHSQVPAHSVAARQPASIATSSSMGTLVPWNPDATHDDVVWWPPLVAQPLDQQDQFETVSPETLLHLALANSPKIEAVSQKPLIRELQVVEADAEFDVKRFVRSLFEDRNDPVGNSLTTGGAPTLKDHIWSGEIGFQRKLQTGGNMELKQQLGFQNSNSRFFIPQDQGTATLAINYTQPLLRGRGRFVNRAPILIAQSASGAEWESFETELQAELNAVLDAYWDLYYRRALYLQKRQNVQRGRAALETLLNRQSLDALPSQIARARSAMLGRQTQLANAFRDVRNAETELRRVVAESQWLEKQQIEILPVEHPGITPLDLPLVHVVETALEHRPEIRQSAQRLRIAAMQVDVSENEILPELNFLFGTYVSALRGNSGVLDAWQRQFTGSTPGYSVGLEWSLPRGNRAAQSRLAQARLQLRQLQAEVEQVTQQVIADAQIAFRRVESAVKTIESAYGAIQAARQDLEQQESRWKNQSLLEGDVGNGVTPTVILDQLLDAQDRLAAAEQIYAKAVLEHQQAIVGLHRATGTLLLHEDVSYCKTDEGWVPSVLLNTGKNAPQQPVFEDPPTTAPSFNPGQ